MLEKTLVDLKGDWKLYREGGYILKKMESIKR